MCTASPEVDSFAQRTQLQAALHNPWGWGCMPAASSWHVPQRAQLAIHVCLGLMTAGSACQAMPFLQCHVDRGAALPAAMQKAKI